VAFHEVWSGVPLVLTLTGWGLVVKGLLYLAYPKRGVRMLSRVSLERAWEFRVAGVFSLALSVLLAWPLLAR